jgi:hypothetical protein
LRCWSGWVYVTYISLWPIQTHLFFEVRRMNLLDVKKLVIEMSGRADLVINETAYADAGIMEYINAGQRFLEDYRRLPHMQAPALHTLAANQYAVHDPYLKVLKEVWVVASDGTRTKLAHSRPGTAYPRQDYSAITAGTPGYYWLEANRLAADEILNDVSLSDGANTWTDNGTWAVSNGWVKHTAGDVNSFEQVHAQLGKGYLLTANSYYLVGFEIREQPIAQANGLRIDLCGTYGTYRTIDGVYYEVIKAGSATPYFALEPDTDFTGKVGRFSVKLIPETSDVNLFRSNWEETVNSVIILPPADGVYELELYGDFYTPFLVHNGDVNFWTLGYSMLLAQAANVFIEGGMRNTAGVRDFMTILDSNVKAMKSHNILQSVANVGSTRSG